jgi:hypothetical protein
MTGSSIRSGPEIVKEFIDNLEKDKSLDNGTVEIIKVLHAENKLTQTRLQQALEVERKESGKHG